MNGIIVLTIAAAALAAAAFAAPAADDFHVHFVTFVHRHGDRSPVSTYPNDPYKNESLWNNGWGELTTRGKLNAYNLGKWLRERYANFLPRIYSKKDYEVSSTDFSRTLMSAYLVLSSLYEPVGTDVWNPEINWQPIPVHTTPLTMDNVLAMGKPCPKHSKLQLEFLLSKEIMSQLEPLGPTLATVVRLAGYNSTNTLADFMIAAMIYDSLNVQNENGLEIPKWARQYFPQPLKDINALVLRFPTYNKPLQRLFCGLLVKDILEHFKQKVKGTLTKKMWHYSAHDTTIVALRQCLGFQEKEAPPYASALLLELGVSNKSYFVRILFKAGNTLKTLVMPGCSEYCPLQKFEELVTPIIPQNWDLECQV